MRKPGVVIAILFAAGAIAGVLLYNIAGSDDPDDVPEADGVLIDYERSGGFAGTYSHLVIEDDGTGTLDTEQGPSPEKNSEQIDLTDAELDELEDLVSDVDWGDLESEYMRGGVADAYMYVLIHDGVQVTTMDAAIPDELQPLISHLSGIIDS